MSSPLSLAPTKFTRMAQRAAGLGLGLMSCLGISCTYLPQQPTQTLPHGWALLEQAEPLACSSLSLPTNLRLHNLGYTAITPKEGVFWAEGWSSPQQRLLLHAHSQHMRVSQRRQVAIRHLETGERGLGIYLAHAPPKLLLFKAIETHAGAGSTFELVITELISTTELLRAELSEFMYASDLTVHPLSPDSWILSGYVDEFHFTMISLDNKVPPQVNTLPPEFTLAWTSPQGLVISRLGQDTLTIYTHSSKNLHRAAASTAMAGFQLTDITPQPHPEAYALALVDEQTLLIAYTALATTLSNSAPAATATTNPSPPAGRQLYLGTIDLATSTLTITGQIPLDEYLTYQDLQLKFINNQWYLLYSATLNDEQVIYSYNIAQLNTPAQAGPIRRWWLPSFFHRTSPAPPTRGVFGPLPVTDHLSRTITHKDTLTFLLKHSNGQHSTHYSSCTLSP